MFACVRGGGRRKEIGTKTQAQALGVAPKNKQKTVGWQGTKSSGRKAEGMNTTNE